MFIKSMNVTAKKSAMIILVAAYFVLTSLVAMATTKLIYKTGRYTLPVGKTVESRLLDVSNHNQIRVYVYNLEASASPITIRFLVMEGPDFVGELESITVLPGATSTKVFNAPGMALKVSFASGPSAKTPNGSNSLLVTVYGSD
jgi:hypothetical protein